MDWESFSRPWLEAAPGLEVAHRPVLDALMEAAEIEPGERVLDVGCGAGPGALAASGAVGAEGKVVGIDIAPPLIERASQRVFENVDLIVGDAGTYDFSGLLPFDLVLSNFGMMFFDDTTAALQNLRKCVRQGSRLAASLWGAPQNNPWFTTPRRIIDKVIGNVPRPDPSGPGPMRFGDPAAFQKALEETGWVPEIKTMQLFLTPPGTPEDVTALHMKVTAGMSLRGLDVSTDMLDRVASDLTEANQALLVGQDVRVPAEIHIVTARAV